MEELNANNEGSPTPFLLHNDITRISGLSKGYVTKILRELEIDGSTVGNTQRFGPLEVKKFFRARNFVYTKKVISFFNIKGGPGKTSLCLNTAYSLAQLGFRVLMLDFDQQGNLTQTCKLYNDDLPTWKDIINSKFKAHELIISVRTNLDLIPCNIGMSDIDREIGEKNIANLVTRHLKPLMDAYDYFLVDTRPEISKLNMATIIASDHIVIPAKADEYSKKGIRDTFKEIDFAESEYLPNSSKNIKKTIIVNLFKPQRSIELEKFTEINEDYSKYIYSEVLHDSVDLAQACSQETFVSELKRSSKVNKTIQNLAITLSELKPTSRGENSYVQ